MAANPTLPARSIVLLITSVLVLGASTPVAAACVAHTVNEQILVPTGTHNPPLITNQAMQHVGLVWWLDGGAIAPNKAYDLKTDSAVVSFCVGSSCTPPLPDFNVAWYDASGGLIADHDFVGDQSGTIPPGTDHGVVYMVLGPDAGTADGSVMAKFLYERHC
ncbi:MAG: hypothetical protein KY455_11850 [Euryarchaeota archaeon]|nr:hypothetical protein [Euryarchaeota archaeon]